MRWTIHGPVMSLSCGKLLPILSFIYSIFIYYIYDIYIYLFATKLADWHGCMPCPPLRRAEMLAINFPVPNRLQLVEKSSFQVGKDSRRNGGIWTPKTYPNKNTTFSGGIWKTRDRTQQVSQWITKPNKNQRLHSLGVRTDRYYDTTHSPKRV